MKVTIDRFEENIAVVEIDVGKFCDVPKELFPGAKAGDVIDIRIDTDETERRRQAVKELMNELFED